MKKVAASALLSACVVTQAFAFDFDISKLSAGAGYGLENGGVLSVHADYDISDEADKPIKVRVGYDRYTLNNTGTSSYSWSYNVFYVGAYYDFNEMFDLDSKIRPFAGLGYGLGSVSCSGSLCSGFSSPTVGGLYYISGVQYDINEQFSAEASFSVWGGLSIGANYNF